MAEPLAEPLAEPSSLAHCNHKATLHVHQAICHPRLLSRPLGRLRWLNQWKYQIVLKGWFWDAGKTGHHRYLYQRSREHRSKQTASYDTAQSLEEDGRSASKWGHWIHPWQNDSHAASSSYESGNHVSKSPHLLEIQLKLHIWSLGWHVHWRIRMWIVKALNMNCGEE